MAFIWVDWVIAGIVVVSGLISLRRGFLREVLSLLTWIAAVIIAWLFSDSLSLLFTDYIETPSLRVVVAAVILFSLILVAGGIISTLIGKLVEFCGLTGVNRSLGMVFGVLRGGLLAATLVGAASRLPVQQDVWWRDSVLVPHLELVAEWSKSVFFDWVAPMIDQR